MESVLTAAMATRRSTGLWSAALEHIPVAVYVSDERGVVQHYNQACVDLFGRKPGDSAHGFAWRLYTETGAPMLSKDSPIQRVLRTQIPVRGVVLMVERPDGTRVICQPHPTPIFNRRGEFTGAINVVSVLTPERIGRRALRAKLVEIASAISASDRALAALLQAPRQPFAPQH